MKKVNLSSIPMWYHIGPTKIIEWMQKRKFDTLVNNYSETKVEYEIDDIPASYPYWLARHSNLMKSS